MLVKEPGLTTLAPRPHPRHHQQSEQIAAEAQHFVAVRRPAAAPLRRRVPTTTNSSKSGRPAASPSSTATATGTLTISAVAPKAFMRDFEDYSADLVNADRQDCAEATLEVVWEGFSSLRRSALVDAEGTPMLLKLKDWPPDGDIAESLPKRYHNSSTIPDTVVHAARKLNLASTCRIIIQTTRTGT